MLNGTKRNIIYVLFLMFVLLNESSIAQVKRMAKCYESIAVDSSITSLKDDIKIGINTGYKLITSPAHFETSDWIYGGMAVAATGITILVDNDIRNNFKNNHTRLLDNIADVGHNYGNAAYAITFSSAIYLGGKIFREEKYSTTGRMLLESLFYSGVVTTVIKSVIGRSRPYTEDGPSRFNGFQVKAETTSFPSGHTTVAFAVSSVLAERIDNVYASVFLYSLAASTVFQRIYDDQHWASDALFGALIGYTIGKAVVKYDAEKNINNLSVSTYYLQNGGGITLKYNF
ncbi:MAG: phosphatase PAP2 family protein [Melioribacteraceae bacterium]